MRELRLEESAVPALAALGDPQAAVRREAVAVLGWLRHQPALAELARLASADVDPEVRRAATGALGLSREATVLPALCAALADAQWPVTPGFTADNRERLFALRGRVEGWQRLRA